MDLGVIPNKTNVNTLSVIPNKTKNERRHRRTDQARYKEEPEFVVELAPAHPDIRSDSDIRSRFQQNQTSASASASAGGYPRGYLQISAP
ncbi:hypothetical protein PGT21_013130 [Puccinia graminis f. sp. tritici]|uniref:Uncharacterized protein n=1 Tax=Puccinia graminis f. sp. tritici TaxID=56615 RepID=A0A5B0P1C2_PUCGR|nr:hypothetical protein PGT21_013130 [Puccinia graminis f. sp. tritici]